MSENTDVTTTDETSRLDRVKAFYSRNKEVINVLGIGIAVHAALTAANFAIARSIDFDESEVYDEDEEDLVDDDED